MERLTSDILGRVHLRTDLCRFAYLYEYGGLYLDMDAEVKQDCFRNFAVNNVKDDQIFFEATP